MRKKEIEREKFEWRVIVTRPDPVTFRATVT